MAPEFVAEVLARHGAAQTQGRKAVIGAGLIYWPKRGSVPQYKRYLNVAEGNPVQDIISDIRPVGSQSNDRLGFPTQKPSPLLRRIIQASSNPSDLVLDPFCGCGTTVYAAAELKREWIGVDVSYYGIRLIQRRIVENFGSDYPIEVSGIPADLLSAEALADRDQYGFQQWVVGELRCQLWNDGKKGADGIDGEMWFYAGPGKAGRLLAQVKGGRKIGVQSVREFKSVLNDQKAQMGIFYCRADTTADMRREAAGTGTFKVGSTTYQRLQLFTLAEWFAKQRPQLPTPIAVDVPQDKSRSKPKRVRRPDPAQPELLLPIAGSIISPRAGQVLNPTVLPASILKTTSG